MALDINTVKSCLVQTIHADRQVRRTASEELLRLQKDPNFCQLLLQIVQAQNQGQLNDQNEATAQHAAAIYFKNYVKKGWDPVSC